MSFILLNLSNDVLLDVMDKEIAPGLWSKLESFYMTANSNHGK